VVKYERKILQINKIKEIDMKTLIVTGGSLDISWAKDFVRTINAEYIIAADSGLKYIDELGLVPDMILGDYDSVEDGLLDKYKSIDIKTYPKEKDYTDTHIAIINALKAGASVIYILGATGTRMDHTFTNICLLLQSSAYCELSSASSVAMITTSMPEMSASVTSRFHTRIRSGFFWQLPSIFSTMPAVSSIRSVSAIASSSAQISGATTVTHAPNSHICAAFRAATAPPPTIRHCLSSSCIMNGKYAIFYPL